MTDNPNLQVAHRAPLTTNDRSSTKAADVTVVIPTFNRSNFLPEAIESLLNQTIPPRRLIVIDDGSTDDTQEVVRHFGARIEYIRKENAGKAKALNLALTLIDTEYVWFFDDDDAAYPEALEALIKPYITSPMLGFVAGSFDRAESKGSLFEATITKTPYPYENQSQHFQRAQLFRHCTILMSGALLRTEAVRAIGGFNDILLRGQDYDLMVKLASKFEFQHCNRCVYILREHSGLRGPNSMKHDANTRLKVWAEFESEIGEYLISQVPLEKFTLDDTSQAVEVNIRRHNYIVKAWALAPKLDSAYAFTEIENAFKTDSSTPISATEEDLLKNMFNHQFIYHRIPSISIEKLRTISRTKNGRSALRMMTKGIYWATQRRDQSSLSRFKLLFSAAFIFSASVVFGLITPTSRSK
ncbi:glycosyltransferase family 2 protein [Parazoarcus communis]|uniref:Glycosyltransferase 2-like domain-containing protein n=1 Tax=Parazoarcus communis SWub3 = DSM 12120 TaxID=1121029 RepID=A0A323V164_9RHOO|nr:glycosyltransferase family A protein [Parazoarcus communis]NMG70082.1 glycosyltransferase [Parazoarcus communis SWub3 = DSM 12120]PZA18261.1 hypothetical protein DNK49_01630 [Azoarcus communis] [Parazoarcus communis SWub3 = DSM 12120]